MSGYVYSYPSPKENALVIFDHGMGSGHRAYMKEIEKLAAHGYKVISYDHTGCGESGGDGIGGFSGSLSDLDNVIRAVRSSKEFDKARISIVGHSWGAFSTMNSVALHADLTAIVAMSGFISVESIQKEKVGGIFSLWHKDIYNLESEKNPDYYSYNALESLASSDVPALIIHSEDDNVVSFKNNFLKLRDSLGSKDNISFVSVNGKAHNPNYTSEAVRYKDIYFKDLTAFKKTVKQPTEEQKQDFVSRYDFAKMTEQDDKIWQIIFDHLTNAYN